MFKGNMWEWSEVYALLRTLADGKVYMADSELNKLEDVYLPIIKTIREKSRVKSKSITP